MIWLSYAVLTLAAVTLLIWPVIRNAKTTAQETEADQSVYRAQLDEVERDLSHG
ncbi:MAG: c-type cytochrome biogenesis protein CcmI, partial [Rhodospirillaceae bacterium]